MSKPTIVGRECKFAIHIPAKYNVRPDVHLIKERLHYSDGTTQPNIRLIKDFKRPFWVTKQHYQIHKQKKDWEQEEYLDMYECTDSELRDKVAQVLGKSFSRDSLKQLSRSPYLYGSDLSAASMIKKHYQDQYPDFKSPMLCCWLDIETHPGQNNETIVNMITVNTRTKIYTACLTEVVRGYADIKMQLRDKMNLYLPDSVKKIEVDEFDHFPTELEIIKAAFKKVHEWQPDFLAIWNMNYDVPKIIQAIERHQEDPAAIFCDPKLPPELRYFKYIEGSKKKITAADKVTPIKPAMQWHTLLAAASYYVIDAMCVYKQLRISKQDEPSYSLDAILNKELKRRKLKFEKADHLTGMPWHNFMRENYPVEYIVYNRWDCLSMMELDEKTKDLSMTIGKFAGITEFRKFNSQPKRIADAFFYYLKDNEKCILGTVGAKEEQSPDIDEGIDFIPDEDDQPIGSKTLGLAGWVITLRAEMQVNGLKIIEEDPTLETNLRGFVYDLDAISAYPKGIECLSVSKETTMREMINVEGVRNDVFRMQNINLMGGSVNALEYCVRMFNFPTPEQMLKLYKAE